MTCPHCRSSATSQRRHRTELGYRRFRCRSCGRRFNERTGSGFNELHYPTDIVLLAVLWRLRYKLGFRDVAELLLERGYEVTHETIRGWETRFAPLLGERPPVCVSRQPNRVAGSVDPGLSSGSTMIFCRSGATASR